MSEYDSMDEEAMVQSAIDEEMYQATRPHLKEALERTIGLGRSVRDWGEFCLEKFGGTVAPYLKRLLDEVQQHAVKIDGWSESTKQTIFGAQVAPEERDRRVREAAYFRAERRGFVGGAPEQDWIEAEREIDRQIAEQSGIVEKGCEAVMSLSELAVKGFDHTKDALSGWMGHRSRSEGQQAA
jgi:hypothetical protein